MRIFQPNLEPGVQPPPASAAAPTSAAAAARSGEAGGAGAGGGFAELLGGAQQSEDRRERESTRAAHDAGRAGSGGEGDVRPETDAGRASARESADEPAKETDVKVGPTDRDADAGGKRQGDGGERERRKGSGEGPREAAGPGGHIRSGREGGAKHASPQPADGQARRGTAPADRPATGAHAAAEAGMPDEREGEEDKEPVRADAGRAKKTAAMRASAGASSASSSSGGRAATATATGAMAGPGASADAVSDVTARTDADERGGSGEPGREGEGDGDGRSSRYGRASLPPEFVVTQAAPSAGGQRPAGTNHTTSTALNQATINASTLAADPVSSSATASQPATQAGPAPAPIAPAAPSATAATATGEGAAPPSSSGDADSDRVAEQTLRGLRGAINQRGGSVTMQLSPPELGTLRVRVDLQGTAVRAQIEAASETARAALSQQLGTLRGALEGHGLTVEQLNVQTQPGSHGSASRDAAGEDASSRGRQDPHARQQPPHPEHENDPEHDDQPDRPRSRFAQRLLDLVG